MNRIDWQLYIRRIVVKYGMSGLSWLLFPDVIINNYKDKTRGKL